VASLRKRDATRLMRCCRELGEIGPHQGVDLHSTGPAGGVRPAASHGSNVAPLTPLAGEAAFATDADVVGDEVDLARARGM
jgi:hypothetical protein